MHPDQSPERGVQSYALLFTLLFLTSNLLASCTDEKTHHIEFSPTAITPDTHLEYYTGNVFNKYGVQVQETSDGLYTWGDFEGNSGTFDREMLGLDEARESSKPVFRCLQEVSTIQINNDSRIEDEHQPLLELPSDTLSENELMESGIKIITSDGIELHLRRAAVEYLGIDSQHKLVVLISDRSPVLVSDAFDYPEFADVKPSVDKFFARMEAIYNPMKSPEKAREAAIRRIELSQEMVDNPASAQAKIKVIGETTNEEVVNMWLGAAITTDGYFIGEESEIAKEVGLDDNTSMILLTLGSRPFTQKSYLCSYAYSDGTVIFRIEVFDLTDLFGVNPVTVIGADQIYPDPDDFKLNRSGIYTSPDGERPATIVTSHEFEHFRLWQKYLDGEITIRDADNESRVDQSMMERILSAHQRLPNDDGYYFLFGLEGLENKIYIPF